MLFAKSIFDEKSNPSFKLWFKPDCEFDDDEVVLQASFGKKKTHESNEISERMYYLTKSCIFYKKSDDDPRVKGVLSLKMTRLHYNELETPVWKNFKYSLTFVRNRKFTEIYTDNEDTFKEWIQVLRLLTIQTDFHLRYKVVKMIGKGSFARVYLARNLENDEKVAIKAFNKEHILKKDKGVENIREEIEITWNLNHKNLIKMIELHESENSIYMILELLEGGEIFSLSGGCIQYDMALHILKELLKGVKYLASHQIMHRDLKPENIVLKHKGMPIKQNTIKIVDFGLSAFMDDQPHCFVKCGTPGYAAPEVINSESDTHIEYDTKCDIFSLGIIFFFMITGVMPYDGADFMEVLKNNREGKIDFDIPELKAQPSIVLELLKAMLHLDPSKRLSAEQALKSPVFEEGSIGDFGKYTSVEDLDAQLRKFKDKFKRRGKNTDDSLHFNTHPDMQNGIATYQNLSENQSTGSNQFIKSIDYSGANSPDNKSGKGGSVKARNDAGINKMSMYKQMLLSNTQGNISEAYDNREGKREKVMIEGNGLNKMNSLDGKNNANCYQMDDAMIDDGFDD
jgi:serine/threonine protein kinase